MARELTDGIPCNRMASRKVPAHAEGLLREALLNREVICHYPPSGSKWTMDNAQSHQVYTLDAALADLGHPDLDPRNPPLSPATSCSSPTSAFTIIPTCIPICVSKKKSNGSSQEPNYISSANPPPQMTSSPSVPPQSRWYAVWAGEKIGVFCGW